MFPCSRAPSLRCAAAPSTSSPVPQGFCSFVSAGPGTVDLLTVKGLRLLKGPHSVVVHDDLVDASILAEIPPGTRTILVGKRGGDNTSWKQSDIDKLLVSRGSFQDWRNALRIVVVLDTRRDAFPPLHDPRPSHPL